MRRVPEDDRWRHDLANQLMGAPWLMQPSTSALVNSGSATVIPPGEAIRPAEVQQEVDVKPLRVRLRPPDFEVHCYTSGCPGCKAILRRGRPQSHNEECRKCMEEIMGNTEQGRKRKQTADDRIHDYR